MVEPSSRLFRWSALVGLSLTTVKSYFGLPQFCPFQPSGMPVLPVCWRDQSSITMAEGPAERAAPAAAHARSAAATAARPLPRSVRASARLRAQDPPGREPRRMRLVSPAGSEYNPLTMLP